MHYKKDGAWVYWGDRLFYLINNNRCLITDHQRECDGRGLDRLNDPHASEAGHLDDREAVDTDQFDVSQEDVVRLIFDGHQEDRYSLDELQNQHGVIN